MEAIIAVNKLSKSQVNLLLVFLNIPSVISSSPTPASLNANLSIAYLTQADLTHANLSEANLHMAFLNDANLSYANLTGADLTSAKLRGANLRGADLSGADLRDATYDKDTKFPALFDPDAAGMVLVE